MGLFGSGERQPAPAAAARIGSPLRVSAGKNLLASGQRVTRSSAGTMLRLRQPWQARAFAYYDLLGEIKYAAQFYSRGLAPLRLFAGKLSDAGELEETDEPVAVEQLARVQDPGGGRSGLLSAYGRLMFLVGEGNLFVSEDEETGVEKWEMLSNDELRITDSGYSRVKAPSLGVEEYRAPADDDYAPVTGKNAVAYRLWKRHPRYSDLADSTMQGVLDLAEELVLLTQAVRARTRSRLAGAGILFLANEISPLVPFEPGTDEDVQEDPFLNDLTEAMTTPIADEGSAAAVVPLVVRAPLDSIKTGVHHLQIVDPTQLYPETGLRRECIERIALGLDMPPEILLGTGGVNHWGSWMIDEQAWKGHLQPLAQQLVDDLTSAFYQPTLREQGVRDWQRYAIGYDASDVINHPDRGRDAKDLHAVAAIGDRALREAAGFNEDDAPSEKEVARKVGILVRDAGLAINGVPTAAAASGGGGGGGGEPEEGGGGSGGSAEVVKGAPPEREVPAADEARPTVAAAINGSGGSGAKAQDVLLARVLGASEMALLRAREIAGNRVRNSAKRDEETAALIEGVRASDVAWTLGADRVRALRCPTELELVAGASVHIIDAFRLWGVDREIAEKIAALVESHAARTLYQERPPPLPGTFTNYVLGLLTAAAGSR